MLGFWRISTLLPKGPETKRLTFWGHNMDQNRRNKRSKGWLWATESSVSSEHGIAAPAVILRPGAAVSLRPGVAAPDQAGHGDVGALAPDPLIRKIRVANQGNRAFNNPKEAAWLVTLVTYFIWATKRMQWYGLEGFC